MVFSFLMCVMSMPSEVAIFYYVHYILQDGHDDLPLGATVTNLKRR